MSAPARSALGLAVLLVACSSARAGTSSDAGNDPDLDAAAPDEDAGRLPVVVYHPDDAKTALSILVNHGPVPRVVRGWPLIVRASVGLRRATPGDVPITPFVLTASAAGGAVLADSLMEVSAEDAMTPLTRDHLRARRTYVASSTATRSLPLGPLSFSLVIGDGQSEERLEVVDPPAAPTHGDRIEEAITRYDALMLLGDHEAALAVVRAAQDPGETELLLSALEARALLSLGRAEEGLRLIDRTILCFPADTPEPPDLLFELKHEIEAALRGHP